MSSWKLSDGFKPLGKCSTPLCSLCPIMKRKLVRVWDTRQKRFTRIMLPVPIKFDSEGRQILIQKGRRI